jgi:hypothetical protein
VCGGAERALEFDSALEGGEREECLESRHGGRREDARACERYTGDPRKGEGTDRREGFLGHLGMDVECADVQIRCVDEEEVSASRR